MSSPALAAKIRNIKANAYLELPKARLCTAVIHALVLGEDPSGPVQLIKEEFGPNWSACLAVQFMSGRRGEEAAKAGEPSERLHMILAHLIAKEACENHALGRGEKALQVDVAKLRALAIAMAS